MSVLVTSGSTIFRTLFGVAPFRRDDKLAAGQKLFGDFDGLIEQSAGIAAQIQDQRFHASVFEFIERLFQVGRSMLAELEDADVADIVFAERKLTLPVEVFDGIDF